MQISPQALVALVQPDRGFMDAQDDYMQAVGWLSNTVAAVLAGEMGMEELARAKADFDAMEQAYIQYVTGN